MSKAQPSINLERSELRYVFFSHDDEKLIHDFVNLGFVPKVYEESPITKTIYFGSSTGLELGLSIKARIYSPSRSDLIWRIDGSTPFNLLEIKSTISMDEALLLGIPETIASQAGLLDFSFDKETRDKDIVYRIQKASESGILRDSSYKAKSRLEGWQDVSAALEDVKNISATESNLKFSEIVTIISKKSILDKKLSPELRDLLNKKIRPFYQQSLVPYVLTQYRRIHLIPQDPSLQDIIRVTVDPGVEYYQLILENPTNFIEDPRIIAEFTKRERFCRLEFKLDPVRIAQFPLLEQEIGKVISRYGCMAYLSKKWVGTTLVSERHIEKMGLWSETATIGISISGYFPVDESWFNYRKISGNFYDIIVKSPTFDHFEKNPRILVKSENYIIGYLGVPTPSLVVMIEGSFITYRLPAHSYPVKLTKDQPEFFISEEYDKPLRSISVSTKDELDRVLHPSIYIEGVSFFRSYGFLVISNNSSRVFKLTIERKTDTGLRPRSETYCKMRYVGIRDGLPKSNIQGIYDELQQFYTEFWPIMTKPLEKEENILQFEPSDELQEETTEKKEVHSTLSEITASKQQ